MLGFALQILKEDGLERDPGRLDVIIGDTGEQSIDVLRFYAADLLEKVAADTGQCNQWRAFVPRVRPGLQETILQQGIDGDLNSGGELADVGLLFIALWPALAALFISHAYSFFANFIGREEYRGRSMQQQMTDPYSRIIFMHLVLIFGGGLALFLQDTTPVLVIVIIIKIFVDLKSHIRERSSKNRVRSRK